MRTSHLGIPSQPETRQDRSERRLGISNEILVPHLHDTWMTREVQPRLDGAEPHPDGVVHVASCLVRHELAADEAVAWPRPDRVHDGAAVPDDVHERHIGEPLEDPADMVDVPRRLLRPELRLVSLRVGDQEPCDELGEARGRPFHPSDLAPTYLELPREGVLLETPAEQLRFGPACDLRVR